MVNYTVKMFFYIFYRRSPMRCAMGWSMAGSGMYSSTKDRTAHTIAFHVNIHPPSTVPVGGPARRHFCFLFYNASCHRHHRFLCFRGTSSLSLITASRWRSLPAKLRGSCPRTFRASGSAPPLRSRSTAFKLLPSLSLGRFPILLPSFSAPCSVSSDFSQQLRLVSIPQGL